MGQYVDPIAIQATRGGLSNEDAKSRSDLVSDGVSLILTEVLADYGFWLFWGDHFPDAVGASRVGTEARPPGWAIQGAEQFQVIMSPFVFPTQ